MSLLSFQVAYSWQSCDAAGQHCRAGADATAAPFAARSYVPGQAEDGRRLRVTETAAEVVQTERVPFNFQVIRRAVTALAASPVRAYPLHRAPGHGVRQRRPRKAHGLDHGVLPGRGGARQPGRRFRHAVVPRRRRPVAGPAEESRLLHRDAGARPAPGERAHCQPGRCQRDRLFMAGRSDDRAAALSGPVLVPAAPGQERAPDALGLADRPDHPAAAHRAQRGGHLRHRRLPHHQGPGHRDQDQLAGGHPAAPEGGLLPGPGLGGLPPGRHPRDGLPGRDARQHLLRLPRGTLGRPAPARRAQAHARRADRHVRAEGLRQRSSSTTSTASTRRPPPASTSPPGTCRTSWPTRST